MRIHKQPFWVIILLAIQSNLSGQEVIFREDFSSYADGVTEGAQANGYWRSYPFDCDDGGSINVPGPMGNRWGVFDSVFVAGDMEGACCAGATSGDHRSLVTFTIDIGAYCTVDFSLLLYGSGGLECDPAALEPDFNCSTSPLHDQAVVEYAVGQDTTRAAYICGSEGTGSVRVRGISGDSLRLFIYLSTSDDNEFYALDNIVVTGYLPPDIEAPGPVESCGEYVLPAISGAHLSGQQAYYTEPGGQGMSLAAGTPITASDTLYLYDQLGDCSDQDTLVLVFEPVTRFDSPGDRQACRRYVLPPITGVELSGREAYYTGPAGSGELLIPGAILDASQFIYIHDAGSPCQEEARFFVSINDPPKVQFVTTAPGCNNGADGGIQLQISGAAPFLIDWPVDSLDGKSTVSGLQAGSYEVTVTDVNQCDTSLIITLLQPPPLELNCSVLRPALTPTGNEGIAEITFSGGTAPYRIEWSGPVSGVETGAQEGALPITGLERGEYTVRLTDGQGCAGACSFSVSGPPCDLVLQVDEQPPACFDSSDGAIFTKISTSRPPVQIDWDDDRWDTEDTLTNLPAGLYNVTVTDQLGCVVTADIELTQPNSINLICRNTRPVSTVGGRDGQANILLAGGARPYQLAWRGPVTDSMQVPRAADLDLKNLPAGDYELIVTDARGCSTQCSFTIREPACNLLLFMFQQSPVDCHGEATAAINLGANNGRRPYAYQWSGPVAVGNLEDPANIPAGNYTVTVTDAIGCQDSASISIGEPPPLTINCAQLEPVSMPGESDGAAELRAEGGGGPYDFIWTGPTLGGDFTLSEAGMATLDNLSAGVYYTTVTDELGCEQVCSFEITVFTCELSVELEKEDITCAGGRGGAVRLTIENERTPVTIDWNVDSLDGQIQAENLTAGDYEVVFTDADSCVEVLNFTITEPPSLSLTCTVDNPIQTVNGREGRVDLVFNGGTPPYQLQWNGPASDAGVFQTAQTFSLTDLPAGEYEVVLTDANGCAQNCDFFLTEPGCESFAIELNGQDPSCAEGSDGVVSLSIADTSAGAPHRIDWNVPGQDGQTELRDLPPGSYSVTVTNVQQCLLNKTLSIHAPPALSLSCTPEQPSGPNGSANGRARLVLAGGTPPYEIQWSGPSTGRQIAPEPGEISVGALFPGDYQAVLTDGNGCSATCDFSIAAIACSLSVTADIGAVSCPGAADGFIDIAPAGNIGPVALDWENDLFDGRYYLEGLASGSYQLYLRDSVGCELYTGFFIDEPAPLTLAASGIPPGCAGTKDGGIRIELAGGGQPPYRMGLEEGALVSLNRFPYTFEALTTGNYSLRLVDQNGCEIRQMVSVPPAPELLLQLEEDKTIFRGQRTTIGAAALNFDPVTARWTPKTALETPDQILTEAAPLETTTYTLTLTHASGCTVEDQIRVHIDNRRRAYVPNALRPESAENSRFTVFGGNELLEIKRMVIFDRWGNLVYATEGLLPNDPSRGWDGQAGGQMAPSGVYVYSIEVTYADGGTELLYGEVTLLR